MEMEKAPVVKEKFHITVQDKELLSGETGESNLRTVRELVVEEFRRGEGDAGSQIKHSQEVEGVTVVLAEKLGVSLELWQSNYLKMMAWFHDVRKLAPERKPELRLVMHGKDSAVWAGERLRKMGFSEEFIQKAAADIEAHMGMPFVKRALENSTAKGEFPGGYPDPDSVEGVILRAADSLSAAKMAGDDIAVGRESGCLDRYVNLNLQSQSVKLKTPGKLGAAFETAASAVEEYIQVFEKTTLTGKLGDIERQAAAVAGGQIRKELEGFKIFVENNREAIDNLFGVGGKLKKGMSCGEVLDACTGGNDKESMDRYYLLVEMYRRNSSRW